MLSLQRLTMLLLQTWGFRFIGVRGGWGIVNEFWHVGRERRSDDAGVQTLGGRGRWPG